MTSKVCRLVSILFMLMAIFGVANGENTIFQDIKYVFTEMYNPKDVVDELFSLLPGYNTIEAFNNHPISGFIFSIGGDWNPIGYLLKPDTSYAPNEGDILIEDDYEEFKKELKYGILDDLLPPNPFMPETVYAPSDTDIAPSRK